MSSATGSLMVLLFVAGCRSYGPKTLTHDRMDYSASLAESWKSTMLLNVVKIRYLDLPVFLDVGQLVSSYTLEGSTSVGSTLYQHGQGNSLALGGAARYSQQPTITYSPLTGDKFLEGFLDPIPAIRVFSLMQSGYAADFILQLSVDSLNGLRTQPVAVDSKYQADPDFFRTLRLLREIQEARAIGLQVARTTNGLPATVFFFRSEKTSSWCVLLPAREQERDSCRGFWALPTPVPHQG